MYDNFVSKNEHKENQCLRREQINHGKKQFLLDIVIYFFVLFRCFLYKTYKCQDLLSVLLQRQEDTKLKSWCLRIFVAKLVLLPSKPSFFSCVRFIGFGCPPILLLRWF